LVLLTTYYSDKQMKEDHKDRPRGMNDSRERQRRHVYWEKMKGLKYDVIILKLI
jgi:hypothetical protein